MLRIATDVMAGNGVIHVLDQVIIPPADRGTPTQNIAEVVAGDPQFSTLLTAVQTADLVDTLADENATFTVFAPTNDAFDKIDPTVLANLLADVPALTGVLLQHVVAAEIPSVDAYAANGALVDTVAGEDVLVELVISGTEVSLVVQGATVTVEDVYTTNGVIHVIDTVITETLE